MASYLDATVVGAGPNGLAAGIAQARAIDGPYLAIKDLDGFRAAAQGAHALGYDGKWALHPTQIDVLNDLFAPTDEELEHARGVLDAEPHR
ncbi:MAG: hypothetical protein M3370_01550 [Actinomycetota bacterium]|nr:hypothetical protein [Actinomycetota bacterium]